MAGTSVSGVRGSIGYATTDLWQDRTYTRRFLNSPDALRIKDRHERALLIALQRQIAKGNQVPERLVNEVNEYFGYEVIPAEYIEGNQGSTQPAVRKNEKNPIRFTRPQNPAQTSEQKPEYTSISEMRARFTAADSKNKDGKIDLEEFTLYYIQLHENAGKRFTNPDDPELAKLKKEAENIFKALAGDEDVISRQRFLKIVNYYDSASDKKKDGKIDLRYLIEDIKKFAKEGKDAKISAGQTLEDFLA